MAEDRLPRPTPKRIWQQGQDKWHVDAPVAVVVDRVLAASSFLGDEKAGERALLRLYLAACNLGARTAPSQYVVACIGDK
jgi:hypothetical protein